MSAQLRLLDTVTRAVRAGDRVTCAYQRDHQGIVLDAYDPRAWAGSMAFACREPSEAEVRAHVDALRTCLAGDPADWRSRAPVLWDFGLVRWDDVKALRVAQQKGSP